MVATRSTPASTALSTVRKAPRQPQGAPHPAPPLPSAGQGAAAQVRTALQRAAFLAALCYLVWFVLILGGIMAYEGARGGDDDG